MFNWKRIQQLLGETMREIGILVLVFAPLEAVFAEIPVDPAAILGMIVFACCSISIGIIAEAR